MFQDYAYDSSTNPNDIPAGQSPVQLTLNNLNPNREYDLYLFSQNGGFNNQTTHFTIGANTQTLANSNVTGGPNSFVLNSNYALFSGLTPSNLGSILVSFASAETGNYSTLNGFQLLEVEIPPVPEPSALVLLGGGLLCLTQARRKRRTM